MTRARRRIQGTVRPMRRIQAPLPTSAVARAGVCNSCGVNVDPEDGEFVQMMWREDGVACELLGWWCALCVAELGWGRPVDADTARAFNQL